MRRGLVVKPLKRKIKKNNNTLKKLLTKKEREELQKLINEITAEAKYVVEDYVKNPSKISGSVIQIHSDSPLVNSGSID